MNINTLVKKAHNQELINRGWTEYNNYSDDIKKKIVASKIAECHMILGKSTNGLYDDCINYNFPRDDSVEEAFADTIIAICDIAGMLGITTLQETIKETLK